MPRPWRAYESPKKPVTIDDVVTLAKAERTQRYIRAADEGAQTLLDSLSGAVEQTAEYLYQRVRRRCRRWVEAATKCSPCYERAVQCRPESRRRSVWPGAGERSPRQR